MLHTPTGRIELQHRAFFIRGSTEVGNLVVAANDGRLSILNSDFAASRSHNLSSKIRSIATDSLSGNIAVIEDRSGSLVVLDINGVRLHSIPRPQFGDENLNQLHPGYEDCCFSDSGEFLWLVAPSIVDVEIRMFETQTWSQVHRSIAKDPFGNSSCLFASTGIADFFTLWLADGQGEQQVNWLKREGS